MCKINYGTISVGNSFGMFWYGFFVLEDEIV